MLQLKRGLWGLLMEQEYFYEEPKKSPKFIWGNFGIYYEFQENRPFSDLIACGNRHYTGLHGLKHLALCDFEIGGRQTFHPHRGYINSISKISGYASRTFKCPNCSSDGGLEHGVRAQCLGCGTWLETYGNSLTVWSGIFWKRETESGTRYFYCGKEVSEKEYINWMVYHKLR